MEGGTPQIGGLGIQWRHTEEVLNRYGQLFVSKYTDLFLEKGKKATGALLDSIRFEITSETFAIAVDVHWLDYWERIEKGTLPGHWVSQADLINWIHVKNIIPRPFRNGRTPTVEQLAFLIARKIYNFGIDACPIAEPTLEEVNNELMRELEDAVTADVGEGIDTIIKTIKL